MLKLCLLVNRILFRHTSNQNVSSNCHFRVRPKSKCQFDKSEPFSMFYMDGYARQLVQKRFSGSWHLTKQQPQAWITSWISSKTNLIQIFFVVKKAKPAFPAFYDSWNQTIFFYLLAEISCWKAHFDNRYETFHTLIRSPFRIDLNDSRYSSE